MTGNTTSDTRPRAATRDDALVAHTIEALRSPAGPPPLSTATADVVAYFYWIGAPR
jgi:hypothetical protein